MPKRKRAPTEPSRPNKKRKKNVKKTSSSSQPIQTRSDSDSNTNKLTRNITKKQIIPKLALKYLSNPLDHVLFFNLLSKTKRPRTRLEWDLMSLAFSNNESEDISGDTLHDFYAEIVESGVIDDPLFFDDDDESNHNIMYHIDFASSEYRRAHTKFMDKLLRFVDSVSCIDAVLFGKKVDLFYLYILVTKRGGFDAINTDNKWISILYETFTNYNAHLKYSLIKELKIMYNLYLYPYESIFYLNESAVDSFGDDLYLEDDTDIMDIISKYPFKYLDDIDAQDNGGYWLSLKGNSNYLSSFHSMSLTHGVSSSGYSVLGSIRDVYGSDIVCIDPLSSSMFGSCLVCNIKGMHPYTRSLIDYMLSEYCLREYEIDYIVNELMLKILRLVCALNNVETSMIYAFLIGLNVLVTSSSKYPFKYGSNVIYYKRIIGAFSSFVSRAISMAHNFLSHPKGLGVINVKCPIKKDSFLWQIIGDLYSVPLWIEHTFCIDNLYHSLLSGSPIKRMYYSLIEYIDDNDLYHLLGVMAPKVLLNHSCCANCIIKPFIDDGIIKLGLFAVKDIKKGDELSLNYGFTSCSTLICSESICLCGLRECSGTFIDYIDRDIENCYLMSSHSYLDRFIGLLHSTLTPYNANDKLKVSICKNKYGDWMYKYLFFLSQFIDLEQSNLAHLLHNKIQKRNYRFCDAEYDVKHRIYLNRLRSLSICVERVKYYLKKESEILSSNTLLIPPIKFAEIDEIIARLWNDSDSLINRLLNCLYSHEIYPIIRDIICKCGLMEESQYGLYLIRCKFIEIAKILSTMKCDKINRHSAAADILYLYGNTYRFVIQTEYLSFASSANHCAITTNYKEPTQIDNRYLTRSYVEHISPNIDIELTAKESFIYSSSFPLICLLGWHNIKQHRQYKEYTANAPGTLLLPDIESCYDENCKGLYVNTHRNYIFKCLEQRKSWMKTIYTKQYESCPVNSCPVPQFTFKNKCGLFGSPVLDSFCKGFNNKNNQYIKNIVNGMKNDYNFKPHK